MAFVMQPEWTLLPLQEEVFVFGNHFTFYSRQNLVPSWLGCSMVDPLLTVNHVSSGTVMEDPKMNLSLLVTHQNWEKILTLINPAAGQKPASRFDPTVKRSPLPSAFLFLPKLPHLLKGLEGFFGNDKFFLVTAPHIIFPPGQNTSEFYQYITSSQRRSSVLLMGNKYFDRHLVSI